MAKITAKPKLDIEIQFTVNEMEARALDDLACYGDDAFITAFKEKLGGSLLGKTRTRIKNILPNY